MSCSLLSLPVPAQGGRQADEVSQRPFIEYLLCPVPSRHRDTQVRLSIDGNVGRNLLPDLQMAIRPQEQAKGGGERYAVGDNLSSRSDQRSQGDAANYHLEQARERLSRYLSTYGKAFQIAERTSRCYGKSRGMKWLEQSE